MPVSIMLRISQELRRALIERRMSGERLYVTAKRADLHPSLASHLLNGSKPIERNDPRVFRLAAALGVPADKAIEDDEPTATRRRRAGKTNPSHALRGTRRHHTDDIFDAVADSIASNPKLASFLKKESKRLNISIVELVTRIIDAHVANKDR